MNIPHFDFGGDGAPLHFLHANGYPPDCYKPLFDLLKTQYHLFGMTLRPLWPDAKLEDIKNWHIFSDDLLHFLSDHNTDPVIGVGHSIGATVTLRAALHEPKKFRAIILLDPVLFVPSFLAIWSAVNAIGLASKLHPNVSGALKRRRTFDDLDTVFHGYRSRNIFRYMNDESLRAYVEGITRQKSDGSYELVFSPEWESHIYLTGMHDFDLWRDLPKLEVPTLVIRGAETDIFSERGARLVKQKQPKVKIETLQKSTHILPLEHPREIFGMTQNFLKEIS